MGRDATRARSSLVEVKLKNPIHPDGAPTLVVGRCCRGALLETGLLLCLLPRSIL